MRSKDEIEKLERELDILRPIIITLLIVICVCQAVIVVIYVLNM